MGVDLRLWPYSWAPVQPPRVAYYGGLGSPHNQRDALFCFEQVMPIVWRDVPEAELWIVGSNPPPAILELPDRDARVHVTGFVEEVAALLGTMSVVLCPWAGTYGFRSRIVEAMAVGVPVVSTHDCVSGMSIEEDRDFLVASLEPNALAARVTSVLEDGNEGRRLSHTARRAVEASYSMHDTYGACAAQLMSRIEDAV